MKFNKKIRTMQHKKLLLIIYWPVFKALVT